MRYSLRNKEASIVLRSVVKHTGSGRPGRVFPETFCGGVRPASQNPYPIYDQDLRYSIPYS